MQQHRTAPPATLEAVLERITDANEQTGYTVARVADLVVDIVANRLSRRFGLDPAREVQVLLLCPMYRGPASVASAPWPKQSTPKAPDVATPPSPNGYVPDGRLPRHPVAPSPCR